MSRTWILLMLLLLATSALWAEDSLQVAPPAPVADTLFVIPAGPVAGSFTHASRLAVVDTIAGWAHIQVEGWVPVGAVMDRLAIQGMATPEKPSMLGKIFGSSKKPPEPPHQCEAITKKGTRCTRNAVPGTKYCWQHTPR